MLMPHEALEVCTPISTYSAPSAAAGSAGQARYLRGATAMSVFYRYGEKSSEWEPSSDPALWKSEFMMEEPPNPRHN